MKIKPIVNTYICLPIMLFLLTAYCTVPTVSYAQAPDTLWSKVYGGFDEDVACAVEQTMDGGYIIAGATQSFGSGQTDVWLLKTDQDGDTLWTKTYGGVYFDYGEGVQQTNDGGYIVAANTTSFGAGNLDILFIKTDSLGNTISMTTYGGVNRDLCWSIQHTSDGNYIVAGIQDSSMWLLKIDENCDTMWTMTCRVAIGLEGASANFAYETNDGGYVVVGHIWSYPFCGFHMKTNSMGDTIWTKLHDWDPTYFKCVRQTLDGGYMLCGMIYHLISGHDFYMARTDAQGETLWTKELEGRPAEYMDATVDGNYVITGQGGYSGSPEIYVLKTNVSGDDLWTIYYGGFGEDYGYSVKQTTDRGYICVGYTKCFGAGESDVWILKIERDSGVEECKSSVLSSKLNTATIIQGPLSLPAEKECKVYNIAGRVVIPEAMMPGVYFIQIDGVVTQKVVKIR